MKKIFIYILTALLLLSACSSRSQAASQPSAVYMTQPVSATLTARPSATSQPAASPTAVQPASQPTSIPTQTAAPQATAITPAPTTASAAANATAGIENLNLRLGPGFAYQVSRLLPKGQTLNILGRSNDSLWLEVRLPDGSGGWVFSSYIFTDLVLEDLPIKEASGGANTETTPKPVESITMAISGTAAVVKVNRFPANVSIVAKLGLPGTTPSLVLATGNTDDNGKATLSFKLPAKWADGSSLSQNDLTLQVSTQNGNFSQSAEILYLH